MARRSRADIEGAFYGTFARWNKSERENVLKVLTTLHDVLPDKPFAKPEEPEQATLSEAQ